MSVGTAQNYPQYANADIGYIPTLYAKETLVKYYAKSVIPSITNSKYEGQISNMGDKVVIRTRPDITVEDHKKGESFSGEVPSSEPITLNIDKAKRYAFIIDDIDEKQADIVLEPEFSEDGSNKMRIAIDTDVLGNVYADAHPANQGTAAGKDSGSYNFGSAASPLALTNDNIVEFITAFAAAMGEQDVPEEPDNLFVVLPPVIRWLIMNSDLKNASVTGDGRSILRNGRVGMIDNLTVYASNLLAKETIGGHVCYHVIAGHRDAVTFAAQLVKNETLRAPNTFGQLYRGLKVYGYEVVKPEALFHAVVYRGT